MSPDDTIVALSSAAGPAARAVVRTSGPAAVAVAREIAGDLPAPPTAVRTSLSFAGLACPGWVYAWSGPRSYTGEDSAEYHLPGNPILARLLVDDLVARGLRPATPGEFTARAYLNGRLDLTAAEGVALAVSAHSAHELSAARRLLAGELARRVAPVMDELAGTLALVEAGIDFADEGVTVLPTADLLARVSRCRAALAGLLADAPRLERLSHEPTFVLVGRPNAGKSTLLNALAGYERAVASPVAGTTRDALSAEVPLPRGMVRLTDVAGLDADVPPGTAGEPRSDVARQMRGRAERAAAEADFVVLVRSVDDSSPPPVLGRPADVVVLNKSDLGVATVPAAAGAIPVSARTGENLDGLRSAMDALAFGRGDGGADRLALNARHRRAIADAVEALDRAAAAAPGPPELAAADLRDALDAVGGILGRVTPDDLLGRIFSTFCIGK